MYVKLTDEKGRPVPGIDRLISGLVAVEPFSGSADMTYTFSEDTRGFYIMNDGSADITITINGESFVVKENETFSELFEPFTQVEIETTSAFRAFGRR